MNYGIRKLSLFQDLIGGQMKRAICAIAVALAVVTLGSVAGLAGLRAAVIVAVAGGTVWCCGGPAAGVSRWWLGAL